ncbi:hypothetical protein D3C72_846070 [compost metagenome]
MALHSEPFGLYLRYFPEALVIRSIVVVMFVKAEPSTAGNFAVPSSFTILFADVPVFTLATPEFNVIPEVGSSVRNLTTPFVP